MTWNYTKTVAAILFGCLLVSLLKAEVGGDDIWRPSGDMAKLMAAAVFLIPGAVVADFIARHRARRARGPGAGL